MSSRYHKLAEIIYHDLIDAAEFKTFKDMDDSRNTIQFPPNLQLWVDRNPHHKIANICLAFRDQFSPDDCNFIDDMVNLTLTDMINQWDFYMSESYEDRLQSRIYVICSKENSTLKATQACLQDLRSRIPLIRTHSPPVPQYHYCDKK